MLPYSSAEPMSATRNEREQHAEPHRPAEGPHRPYWKRMHHSWFFWVSVVMIMTAMILYVTSLNLAFRPRGHAQSSQPAGNTP